MPRKPNIDAGFVEAMRTGKPKKTVLPDGRVRTQTAIAMTMDDLPDAMLDAMRSRGIEVDAFLNGTGSTRQPKRILPPSEGRAVEARRRKNLAPEGPAVKPPASITKKLMAMDRKTLNRICKQRGIDTSKFGPVHDYFAALIRWDYVWRPRMAWLIIINYATLEDAVIRAINKIRTDPKSFIPFVKKYAREFNGMLTPVACRYRPSSVRTREGLAAVKEALRFLSKQKPVCALKHAKILQAAARDHTRDQGPVAATGHTGTDGKDHNVRIARHGRAKYTGECVAYVQTDVSARIVMLLVIDDGVPDRGHRRDIFDPKYKFVGVGCGPHLKMQQQTTINFAQSVSSWPAAAATSAL